MRRTTLLVAMLTLPLAAASCTAPAMPPAFLQTESAAWTRWLDREADYGGFTNCTSGEIVRHLAGPADLKIEPRQVLDRRVAQFEVVGLTTRQALWKASADFGLTITWATASEPRTFLDVPETEKQHARAGVTTMTQVQWADREQYLRMKKEGRIIKEEVLGGVLYYAIQEDRDCSFPNGATGHFTEIQRYKTAPAPTVSPWVGPTPHNGRCGTRLTLTARPGR
jgi:hypothetical protein